MKILLLFPMADGQTGLAIKHAFEQLGHFVRVVDAKLHPNDSYLIAGAIDPDLVFCSRTKELTKQVELIKRDFCAKICMWNVDTRANIGEWKHLFELIRLCDYHFVTDTKTIPEWEKINRNTFWLPQGLQHEVYNRPLYITDEDRKKYSCDVSWAGDYSSAVHKFRRPFIKAIQQMGIEFKWWGCEGREKVYGEEHNKMVALSKISLACSAYPENEDCVSVRDYKILGAGGFLLELYRRRMCDVFPTDIFDYYVTSEHLVRKIEYYLEHDEIRKKTAQRGYEWVHRNATYVHRINTILNCIEEGTC